MTTLKLLKARHLWTCRQPAIGSIVETYLRECRGYGGDIPESTAFLPAGTYNVSDDCARDGAGPAIHLTFLKPDGSGKADLDWLKSSKMTLGSPGGQGIILSEGNDSLGMAVTEGIEDGLTFFEATGLCTWAAGSASFMPSLRISNWVETLTICVDADSSGRNGASGLAEALKGRDVEILIEGLK